MVIAGGTGITEPICNQRAMDGAIVEVLARRETHRAMAGLGGLLVARMFSARRTAAEIKRIYEYVLGLRSDPPPEFDSRRALAEACATGA